MRSVLLTLFLFAAAAVSAQQMPERRQVRMGNRAYDRGDYSAGIERYSRALELSPGSFEALYDLGNALCKAEMFDKAEQTMSRAAADTLRTAEERARAYYNLGNAQFKQQKYKEALASYRQSLRLDPTDMEAKYNYAYTKKLLEQDDNSGGGGDDQNNDQNNDQNDDQNDDQNENPSGDGGQDDQSDDPQSDRQGEEQPDDGTPRPLPGDLTEQQQQQMLDAIQAQEDRTQDKLKEKQGTVVRSRKNW